MSPDILLNQEMHGYLSEIRWSWQIQVKLGQGAHDRDDRIALLTLNHHHATSELNFYPLFLHGKSRVQMAERKIRPDVKEIKSVFLLETWLQGSSV